MAVICVVMLVVAGAALLFYFITGNSVGITKSGRTLMTPMQVEWMRAIGEWEFLTVYDEEIVDTVRTGFFGDDELVRIYYGTLRLGVDMGEVDKGWLTARGDAVVATLPAIRLLDEGFIDEARTVSFFESGRWSDESRQRLYRRAAEQMKHRCLSEENLARAERNGVAQVGNVLRSMGFDKVDVKFKK